MQTEKLYLILPRERNLPSASIYENNLASVQEMACPISWRRQVGYPTQSVHYRGGCWVRFFPGKRQKFFRLFYNTGGQSRGKIMFFKVTALHFL